MRTAWRLFSRHRSLTALAVSTLAVAFGLAAAFASAADAILLRPLPVARPNQIVRIFTASAGQRFGFVSYPDFEDFRRSARSLRGVIAQSQVLLAAGGAPAEMRLGLAVTPDYFGVLGVPIAPGRAFRPEESRDPVLILSYDYWQSHYAGDPRAIGRTLLLCATPFAIVGVAPENFGLDRFVHEDFYFPIGVYAAGLLPVSGQPLEDRSRRYLSVYGRLGSNLESARSELNAAAARLETQYAADRGRRAVVFTEFASRLAMDRIMPALAALLGALAALLAAIACANVAVLLRARAEARVKETSIRVALGATPARLVRESLIEGAALISSGAALGVPLAWAVQQLLLRTVALPTDFRFSITPHLDARITIALVALSMIVSLLCGIAPGSRHRLALVEVALATGLVACLGSLIGGIGAAEHVDLGYRMDHVLVLGLDPSQLRYSEARARIFYDQVLQRVRAMAGVKSAELAQSVPLGYTGAQRQIVIGDETLTLWMNIVGPRYFSLMRLPIVSGRGFDDSDSASSGPVAVVNQELAKRCGVGCSFRMNGRAVRVIGVARTARYFQVNELPRPYFYLPFSQNYGARLILHVETAGPPAAMAQAVSDEIHRLDAAQPISEIRVLREYLEQGAMFSARIGLRVLGAAALVGIALALGGVYALMAHVAARRQKEIAIRIALGATRRGVILLLAREALRVLVPGIAIGLAAAAGAVRLLGAFVPQSGSQGTIVAFAAALVALISLPAFLLPARQASAIDPMRILRG